MLKLVQIDNGVFDLAFDDPALQNEDATVATIIYAALFTDQKAPAGRVADPYDQRGWLDKPNAGSGLWYLRRQGLSDKARQEAIYMVEAALAERTIGLNNIKVSLITPSQAAGNVSSVSLQITGLHNGRAFLTNVPL